MDCIDADRLDSTSCPRFTCISWLCHTPASALRALFPNAAPTASTCLKQQGILPALMLYCIWTEHPRLSGRWGGELSPGQQTCHGLTLDKGFHPIHQCLLCLPWAKLWFLDWRQEFAPVALSHNQGLTNEQSACLSIFLPHNSLMRSVLLPFLFTRWEKLRQKLSASHKWAKLLCINTQGSNFHPLLACPEVSTCFQTTLS